MGKLIILTGPSGVGKTTVAKKLLEDSSWVKAVTTTSRSPRRGESEEREYYFVTRRSFEKLISQNELFEWQQYNGEYYGSTFTEIEKGLNSGKKVILAIEIKGALELKKRFPGAMVIFLDASLEELEERLRKRGDLSEEELRARLKIAARELEQKKQFEHVIPNRTSKLKEAVEKIRELVSDL